MAFAKAAAGTTVDFGIVLALGVVYVAFLTVGTVLKATSGAVERGASSGLVLVGRVWRACPWSAERTVRR